MAGEKEEERATQPKKGDRERATRTDKVEVLVRTFLFLNYILNILSDDFRTVIE